MSEPARDPIGDFQRWLMKAGARSLSREVAGKVKSTLGGDASRKHADVWDTATSEPPGDEPPECQWCPICRAARRYRDSGSGGVGGSADLGSQLAGVGDALAGLTKDAFSLFEAAVRPPQRSPGQSGGPTAPGAAGASSAPSAAKQGTDTPASPASPSAGSPSAGNPSDDSTVVGAGVTWAAAVVHAEDEDGEAADEGGHREEGGEPGDAAADRGGDEQVEGTSE
jgi:hypothetical protein